MFRVTVIATLFALFASITSAQPSTGPAKKSLTPDALKAEIEALYPAKIAWLEIQWKTCLLEAFAESRAKKKPVFLWVVGQGEGLGRF